MFTFVLIVFGIGLPAALLIGNHNKANGQVGGIKLTSGEKQGRELFGQHCGVCHTLAAANAVGKVGPNLDTIKPSASLVLHTIDNGCLPNAPNGLARAVPRPGRDARRRRHRAQCPERGQLRGQGRRQRVAAPAD